MIWNDPSVRRPADRCRGHRSSSDLNARNTSGNPRQPTSVLRVAGLMNALLDAAKAKLDCATDSELASALGVRASRICNYRKGRALPNAWMARRIARALKARPGDVMLHIHRVRKQRRR